MGDRDARGGRDAAGPSRGVQSMDEEERRAGAVVVFEMDSGQLLAESGDVSSHAGMSVSDRLYQRSFQAPPNPNGLSQTACCQPLPAASCPDTADRPQYLLREQAGPECPRPARQRERKEVDG